jgi:hypothetical protein
MTWVAKDKRLINAGYGLNKSYEKIYLQDVLFSMSVVRSPTLHHMKSLVDIRYQEEKPIANIRYGSSCCKEDKICGTYNIENNYCA